MELLEHGGARFGRGKWHRSVVLDLKELRTDPECSIIVAEKDAFR